MLGIWVILVQRNYKSRLSGANENPSCMGPSVGGAFPRCVLSWVAGALWWQSECDRFYDTVVAQDKQPHDSLCTPPSKMLSTGVALLEDVHIYPPKP